MLKVMFGLKSLIDRFAKDEDGATAIEYGLFAALIAAVIVTVVTNLGTGVEKGLQDVVDALPSS